MQKRFLSVTLAALIALALIGPAPAALAADPALALFVLTTDGKLAATLDSAPGQISTPVTITGINPNETLVAIDTRPQNGRLYALGYNAPAGSVQLYAINPGLTIATAIGTTGSFVDGASAPVRIGVDATTTFGMDFNPAVDRLRVVTSSGQNFRMNPNTGAFIDGDLGGAAGSVIGLNQDGAINGATTTVAATAYTNSQPNNGGITTQYTLDATTNSLYIQTPPNSGTQTAAKAVTLNGAPLDFADAGLDIAPGVNAAASNTAVTSGTAIAALRVAGADGIYRIDLTTGAATSLGAVSNVRDIAIYAPTPIAIGLSADGAQLLRFNPNTPTTVTTVTITGVTAGETLVGVDLRPLTGQFYGLGVNATADTATLYLIDPQTGVATVVGTPGQIAFTADGVTAVDLPDPATTGYGVSFNGAVDRLRVVTGSGLNFRIDQRTGVPIDGNAGTTGTNPDGALNGAATGLTAVGYTQVAPPLGTTTLYGVDVSSDKLYLQNPPNNGTLTAVGSLGVDAVGFGGLTDAGAGQALAALTVGGVTGVYTVSLTSGAATSAGVIAGGITALRGLTTATPGQVSVSAAAGTVREGKPITLTLTRTSGSLPLIVGYTIGGAVTQNSDYQSTPATVLFAAGELTKTVTIQTLTDAITEGDEPLVVTLTGSAGGGRNVTVIVQDINVKTYLPYVWR